MTRLTLIVVAVLLTSAAFAQAPAATPAPAPPAAKAAVAPGNDHLPTPPADFSYSAGGRRDPFMALTRPGGGKVEQVDILVVRGPQDILADELTVKGIVFTNGAFVAMVSGAAGKTQTYSVRAGAKLHDGTVKSIDARSVVIVQQVSDPLSVEKQREVRKLLRTQEEGK